MDCSEILPLEFPSLSALFLQRKKKTKISGISMLLYERIGTASLFISPNFTVFMFRTDGGRSRREYLIYAVVL